MAAKKTAITFLTGKNCRQNGYDLPLLSPPPLQKKAAEISTWAGFFTAGWYLGAGDDSAGHEIPEPGPCSQDSR